MSQGASDAIHEVEGKVVLAQEDRFRLETEDGRSFLLVVGAGAGADIEDLESLAGSGKIVRVRFQGKPEAGAVALEVFPD